MLQARLQARIDQKKSKLDALRSLPSLAVRRLQEGLMVEWIYNSNAIEGNTLTLQETRLILETGLTIGGKSLRVQVRQIHQLALAQIEEESAGQYRQLPVHIAGSAHTPPDSLS